MSEPVAGDGLDAFVAARAGALWRSAWLLTGDAHLAEDLLQAALGTCYRKWDRLGAAEFEPYLRRVMFTTFLRWRRRRSYGETPVDRLPESPAAPAHSDDRHDLVLALGDLPARQRAVIVLRYFDDLTEAQAAEVLGCSVGTVKSHAARAMKGLRVSPHLHGRTGEDVER